MAGASLGAQRGIGGDACSRTGVGVDGRRCALSETSASRVEALVDAPEAALCFATAILSLEGCIDAVVHAPRQHYVTARQKKFRISILVSRRSYRSTPFLRAHHVQI